MIWSFMEDLVGEKKKKRINYNPLESERLASWHICIWRHLTTSEMLHFKELVHIYCTAYGLERLPILRSSCVPCAPLSLQH